MERSSLSPEIIEQILLMPGNAADLPDKKAVLFFICNNLKIIPGVLSVDYVDLHENKTAHLNPEEKISFRIGDDKESHSELTFVISEKKLFVPYIPFIENMCRVLSFILEEKRLKDINIGLQEGLKNLGEKKARESEQKFQNYINYAPDGIFIADEKGNYLEVNKASSSITGYSVEELLGMNLIQLIPEDWHEAAGTHFGKVVQEGFASGELPFVKKDGSKGYWAVDAVKLSQTRFMAFVKETTERKHAEEALLESRQKLEALFSAMTEMVVLHELVFDEKGEAVDYRVTDCNEAFTKITGLKKENAINKLATELYQSDPPPYFKEYKNVAISGKPEELTVFYEPMAKHFQISVVSPQKNKFATITADVTDIKQIGEIIAAKNKELENYLYVASHDLRSPLVNIQGFSQMLKENIYKLGEELKLQPVGKVLNDEIEEIINSAIPKTLDFIFTNVSKMDVLLNGLSTISRTGRIKMNIALINMNELIREVINSFQFEINSVGASAEVKNLHSCYGDINMLNQLFSNLIKNAIKYRDPVRPLNIIIQSEQKFDKVIYSVSDTGIGINLRHLEKIWDVFFRIDPRLPETGEGIGLSIVKKIVSKHKGEVRAESEENKGSIFYIELSQKSFCE